MPTLYAGPEYSFGAFDFTGTGIVTVESIVNSLVASKLTISLEEFKDFMKNESIFHSNQGKGVTFDQFKGFFYPHLTMAGLEPPTKKTSIF